MIPGQNKTPFRCGLVAIIGRPNVGKSLLFNSILEEKVSIVSKVPQTTRQEIRGIYNHAKGQIIFLDTPGIHHERDQLDKYMNTSSLRTIHDADCIIHLVDAHRPVGWEEERIVQKLKDVKAPVILGLNKIDLKGQCVSDYISLWERLAGKSVNEIESFVLLPLSAKTGFNIDLLLDLIWQRLPKGPALYPPESISDVSQKIAVADTIREKLLGVLREEVPHAIGVVVEQIQPKRAKLIYIEASIFVERDSQKQIVIGKKGQILKNVGSLARLDLETLLESKVFLDLHVKTQKHWRDNPSLLQQMGYSSSGG